MHFTFGLFETKWIFDYKEHCYQGRSYVCLVKG
jgi:hypothetical protein